MSIDVQKMRAETPGCAHVIHLNNAGCSLPPRVVLDAAVGFLEEEAATGGYETAEARWEDLEAIYTSAATLLGAESGETAVTDSATRAWDIAFASLQLGRGDRILTTTSEYGANYIAYLQLAQRDGVVTDVVPDTATGEIDVAALADMIDDRVRLISINHVPTNGGLVNPAAAVGRVANAASIPYLLDACQSVGQLPVDVRDIGCDYLSVTGRKFLRGPRGTGLLYMRREVLETVEPAVLDLWGATWVAADRYEVRPDARRFELWEMNLAAKLGLQTAIDYAMTVGLDAIWERVQALGAGLRQRLAAIDGVTVHDLGAVQGAIVTFTVDGYAPEEVKAELRRAGINVSTVTPGSARLDMEGRGLIGLVRASVHYFNSEAELDACAAAVAALDRRR
jgi:cysteine desulfurase/selenocysteine lyase